MEAPIIRRVELSSIPYFDYCRNPLIFNIYRKICGPLSILFASYLTLQVLNWALMPIDLHGHWIGLYLGFQTWYRVLLVGTVGIYLFRFLTYLRPIILFPWHKATPPFKSGWGIEETPVERSIVETASFRGSGLILLGFGVSIILPSLTGYAPVGKGAVGYVDGNSPAIITWGVSLLSEVPLASDLLYLDGLIYSPTLMGYAVLTLPIALTLVGVRNIYYLFRYKPKVTAQLPKENSFLEFLLTWMPRAGIILAVISALLLL